jgi:hypothetical protein
MRSWNRPANKLGRDTVKLTIGLWVFVCLWQKNLPRGAKHNAARRFF